MGIAIVGAILAVVPAPVALSQSTSVDSNCPRRSLGAAERPSWTVSADWLSDDELVIVDSLPNRLLHYRGAGEFLEVDDTPLRASVTEKLGNFHPSSVVSTGGPQHWLELTGGRLIRVQGSESLGEPLNLLGLAVGPARRIGALFDWALAGSDLVGFGNLKNAEGVWTTGFYRVNLGNPSEARVLKELPRYAPEKLWYRVGFNYITSLGDTGFVLEIGEHLSIAKSEATSGELRTLNAFPVEIREPPELPDFAARQN